MRKTELDDARLARLNGQPFQATQLFDGSAPVVLFCYTKCGGTLTRSDEQAKQGLLG